MDGFPPSCSQKQKQKKNTETKIRDREGFDIHKKLQSSIVKNRDTVQAEKNLEPDVFFIGTV